MSDEDLEVAVAAYRAELTAEADLARGDLDEIEDHLRVLIDELRAAGRGAEAIEEARRRLGEPRAIAREHARVRTPFGARPSRAQAWSAALLLGPVAIWQSWTASRGGGWMSQAGLELVLALGLCAALIARQAWARAVLLGHAAMMTIPCAVGVWMWPDTRLALLLVGCFGGAALFLAPRRRGELSATGAALALLAPAYSGASLALALQITRPFGEVAGDPTAMIALGAALAAGTGLLLRARWGCVAAAVCAVALIANAWQLDGLRWRFAHADAQRALVLGMIIGGAIAAAAAAVVAWSSARRGAGTVRGVLSA